MSADPLVALCTVAAVRSGLEPKVLVSKVEPLLSNPALREIATLFLTNIDLRVGSNKAGNNEPDAILKHKRAMEIRSQISDLEGEIAAASRTLDATTQNYKDMHDRLARANALSSRRQLLDSIETIISSVASSMQTDPTQRLGDMASETSQAARNLSKLGQGQGLGSNNAAEGISEIRCKVSTDEFRKGLMRQYFIKISELRDDLDTERAATTEINDLVQSVFPDERNSDSSFIRNNIKRQLEFVLGRAEIAIIKKKIEEREVRQNIILHYYMYDSCWTRCTYFSYLCVSSQLYVI